MFFSKRARSNSRRPLAPVEVGIFFFDLEKGADNVDQALA